MLIKVKGDNLAMLTMMLKMKPSSSPAIGLLARETALLVAESSFQPQIRALHISGLANAAADALSRRDAPHDKSSSVWTLPAFLASVPETISPARPRGWYRTLSVSEVNGVPHKRSVLPSLLALYWRSYLEYVK